MKTWRPRMPGFLRAGTIVHRPAAGGKTLAPGGAIVEAMDPLAGSSWSRPQTVAGFAQSAANRVLLGFAGQELRRHAGGLALDLGCGAGRNAVPLAELGWNVVGVDLSWPMLTAAAPRAQELQEGGRLHLILAPMDHLPVRDGSVDLVIAHGIWNLARSSDEFRRAVREAARVARPGAGLFVFTFSRTTLPPAVRPVAGEPFVFTEFSGEPQCFLTETQLFEEMAAAGFAPDPAVPLTEYNRPSPGALPTGRVPVIWEAAFRSRAA
ncbi:MAG TPA: class I SAM-dependent methyltransferase [Methylomirabilota bacterium]|nr:class I SAM-dependent methyltransferase [Methylomirabilota bacterium]